MSKPAHDNYMALAARLVRTCLLRHETLSESVSCRSVLRGKRDAKADAEADAKREDLKQRIKAMRLHPSLNIRREYVWRWCCGEPQSSPRMQAIVQIVAEELRFLEQSTDNPRGYQGTYPTMEAAVHAKLSGAHAERRGGGSSVCARFGGGATQSEFDRATRETEEKCEEKQRPFAEAMVRAGGAIQKAAKDHAERTSSLATGRSTDDQVAEALQRVEVARVAFDAAIREACDAEVVSEYQAWQREVFAFRGAKSDISHFAARNRTLRDDQVSY
jgi:hypothetical protein